MPQHPLLDHWMKEFPGLVLLCVFLMYLALNLPKPGRRWTRAVVYAWLYRSLTAFAQMIQNLLPKFLLPGRNSRATLVTCRASDHTDRVGFLVQSGQRTRLLARGAAGSNLATRTNLRFR